MSNSGTLSLTLDYETGPVTALSIISNNLIFAGVCGNLHVYNVTTRKLLHVEKDVVNKQQIHGIKMHSDPKSNSRKLCIYGGKGVNILTVKIDGENLEQIKNWGDYKEFEDWIWDVIWLTQDEDYSTIALALAHNIIIRYDWTTHKILDKVHCTEKCILYSAHFIGETWRDLLLAAGTVFNQIVIWSPTSQVNSDGLRKVIIRLEGHQGVIFSIHYRPETQTIVSASDDRSTKLWRLIFPKTFCDWNGVTSKLLLTLHGHSARVWSARLLPDKIVSIGEDSTCCVWNYEGDILHKYKGHNGKNIWCADINEDYSFIVTGGGDSSIRLWNMKSSRAISDVHTSLPVPVTIEACDGDIPRSVVLITYNLSWIMTNSGALWEYNITMNTWRMLYHDSKFKSYSLMVTSPDEQLTAVGNIEGDIRIFDYENSTCQRFFNGKVYGLVWVDPQHCLASGPEGNLSLIEMYHDTNNQLVANIKARFYLPVCRQRWVSAGLMITDDNVLVCGDRGGTIHNYRLNTNSSHPVQSFPKIHGKAGVTSVIQFGPKIFSSGRDGYFRIWNLKLDGMLEILSLCKVFKGLEWIDRLFVYNQQLHIYGFHSTNFIIWSKADDQLLVEIECGGGHRSWDCKLKGESARFIYIKNGKVILHHSSLQSNHLILKPGLHGREICDVKHVTSVTRGNGVYHVLVTASEDTTINISVLLEDSSPVLLQPIHSLQGHLSSVRTLSISPTLGNDALRQYVLFSGGGRAQIEIWKLKIKEGEVTRQSGDQIENYQTIEELCDTNFGVEYEHLSSYVLGEVPSKRGLKPWRKHQLKPDPETRVLCLTSFCGNQLDEAYNLNLHFIGAACSDGFVRLFCFNESDNKLSLIDQSEYHNNCVLQITYFIHKAYGTQAFLLSGATEGVVAFWDISNLCIDYIKLCNLSGATNTTATCEKTNEHDSVGSSDGDSSNNDETAAFHSGTSDNEKNLCYPEKTNVISAKTESSKVEMWNPCFTIQCHQSGINSLDIYPLPDNSYMLATGGDDNCITIHKLVVSNNSIHILKSGREINAHAAQITGLKVLSPVMMLTVSLDNRLNLWNVIEYRDNLQITTSDCKVINVSDVANMDVWQFRDEICYSLCGVGLAYGHIS